MAKLKDLASEPCNDTCPVQRAATILDGKWTTLIVRDLIPGKKRFSELMRSLGTISPRMLSARLTMLEENGLIEKTIYPTVPPRTEYELTERGRAIEPVIAAMYDFGQTIPVRQSRKADTASAA